jgi:tetratricopeptide (TPR) repeat protein
MNRSIITATILLFLIITYGCASRYPIATPYHKPDPPPIKHKIRQPDTPVPTPSLARRPTDALSADISKKADQLLLTGQPEAAAQTIERGLRIAPKNGYLWSKLAEVRLTQHRFDQALSLAKKSNSLARGNTMLIDRNQQIMEQVKNQHN